MRTIAVINQKGGVGKTTSTAHLAAGLGLAGKRVLAIDLDPQAHLTINFGAEPSEDVGGIYSVLTDGASVTGEMMVVQPNVWLLPAHVDLAAAECELVSVVGREVILREALTVVTDHFDYVLIDCPPSLGILTVNALAAVNEVIIPLQPHFLALQGLGMLLNETIRLVGRRINPQLRVTGIVVTMHEGGTRLASEVVSDVRSFFDTNTEADCPWANARVFETVIRRNIKLAEAPGHGQTIFEYAPKSNGAVDYRRLTNELLEIHGEVIVKNSQSVAKVEPKGKSVKKSGPTRAEDEASEKAPADSQGNTVAAISEAAPRDGEKGTPKKKAVTRKAVAAKNAPAVVDKVAVKEVPSVARETSIQEASVAAAETRVKKLSAVADGVEATSKSEPGDVANIA